MYKFQSAHTKGALRKSNSENAVCADGISDKQDLIKVKILDENSLCDI